jgi:hypothetical protein
MRLEAPGDVVQVLVERVAVDGQSERRRPMTEDRLHRFRRRARTDERGGGGVPQSVDPDRWEPELGESRPQEASVEVLVPERAALRSIEDEGVVRRRDLLEPLVLGEN